MVGALISLLILILVVAVVASVLIYCVALLPMEPNFHQIIRALILLIAALIIILRALPLLGVAV